MMRACVAAIVAWSAIASAEPAAAQAEILFREGRKLMTAGKTAEACSAFEESQRLDPAITTLLNLASCREKLGQLATAWGLYLDAERATRSGTDATAKQMHDVAQTHAHKLQPRVSTLTINVPARSRIDGLEITRGKDRVTQVMWGRALPIDGDTYTISATAPGRSPWSKQITVAKENDAQTVEVPNLRELERDTTETPATRVPDKADKPTETAAAPAPTPAEPEPDRDETPETTTSKKPALIAGLGALVLGGGAIAFDLWGDSTYDQAKAEMTNQARRDSLESSANTKRYVAQGLAVGGIACAGVAVWLYFRHPEQPNKVARGTHVVPSLGSGPGLAVLGSF